MISIGQSVASVANWHSVASVAIWQSVASWDSVAIWHSVASVAIGHSVASVAIWHDDIDRRNVAFRGRVVGIGLLACFMDAVGREFPLAFPRVLFSYSSLVYLVADTATNRKS